MANAAGFSFAVATFLPVNDPLEGKVLADALPAGWIDHYRERGFGDFSPVSARSQGSRPFRWSLSDWDGRLTRRQRAWRDDAAGAGLLAGYNIPYHVDGDCKVIAVTGAARDNDPRDLMALHFAGFEVMSRMRELEVGPARLDDVGLSGRERECLKWVASGKTDWEIGVILGLNAKTVNHYVERAKVKLSVTTRVQAVVAALRHGWIKI